MMLTGQTSNYRQRTPTHCLRRAIVENCIQQLWRVGTMEGMCHQSFSKQVRSNSLYTLPSRIELYQGVEQMTKICRTDDVPAYFEPIVHGRFRSSKSSG